MKNRRYYFDYCYENPSCDPKSNIHFLEYMEECRKKAIVHGSSLTKYYLVLCFEKRGYKDDLKEAEKWYKESGHVYAQLRLALLHNVTLEKHSRVIHRYAEVKRNIEHKIYWLQDGGQIQ